jgi:NADPH:quinone reductase-like Zn-dependent oxidoreductase
MKAIVQDRYGSPDVLELRDIDKPEVVKDDQLLVRVQAASLNPYDWHFMRGTPYFMRAQAGLRKPKTSTRGADFAGRVEAVGKNVKDFHVGDEVFGEAGGAFAEYVTTSKGALALKPANLTFEQAAAVPMVALTALQGLRDKGQVQPGQKVLINGAAGGVGTFAVQIAKSFGAEVTGVCSTRNVDMVRSIGADHVVDYTQEDFARSGRRYDLMLDIVGGHSLSDCRRVLTSKGTYIFVGSTDDGRWLGPLAFVLRAVVLSRFVSQKMLFFVANCNADDLVFAKELIEAGKLTPVIDRTYPLAEVPEAIRYLEEGHARGKIVITV